MMTDLKVASFVWTIKHFDMYPHLTGESFRSPDFKIGSWRVSLHLYPRGRTDSKYVCLHTQIIHNCGAQEPPFTAEIYLIGGIPIPGYNREYFQALWGPMIYNDYFNIMERDIILTTGRTTFLPNNKLTIKCDLLSLPEYDKNSRFGNDTFCDYRDAESLSRDFDALLNSGIYSDMVLIINENKFKVHKSILNCRCPQLVLHPKDTELPDEHTLNDIEAPVLRILLQYLYTGTFNVTNAYEEMLIASGKYNMPHLEHLLTFPHYKLISMTTELPVSELSFRWVIKNFSKLQVNEELVYPAFYTTYDEWSKMKIILTVIKIDNGLTRVQLRFRKLKTTTVAFIRCKISTATTDIKTTVNEYEHIFPSTSSEDWITPFGSDKEINQILLNDTLDTFFEISMSKIRVKSKIKNVSVETRTEETGKAAIIKNLKSLQTDLGNLYYYESNTGDITLRVGDANYTAHKFIMCGRSPVFARMFENDTLEKKEGVVTIEDIDAQTVSFMLRYIYCGYIDKIDISEAIKLYAAADKYELLSLKDTCSNFLKASEDADRIGEILLLADAHHDNDLKSCVYNYMTSNPDKVLESKDALSVLKHRLDVYPDILNAFLRWASSNASTEEDAD